MPPKKSAQVKKQGQQKKTLVENKQEKNLKAKEESKNDGKSFKEGKSPEKEETNKLGDKKGGKVEKQEVSKTSKKEIKGKEEPKQKKKEQIKDSKQDKEKKESLAKSVPKKEEEKGRKDIKENNREKIEGQKSKAIINRMEEPLEPVQRTKGDDYLIKDTGLLEAYEIFLRTICKFGLPTGDIYEFAAQQIEKYERKKKAKQLKMKAEMEIRKAASKRPKESDNIDQSH